MISWPGEKGPGMDCTRSAGLVKLTAMESMGGNPSGEICISMVMEEEVEEDGGRCGGTWGDKIQALTLAGNEVGRATLILISV